ncbi:MULTISPECIES: hypothetical protein [Bifidobacterium]|uniref:hypothetical protein n=2 Tax=Bifidobacterium TaxID=1678 RepID=UPI0011275357|nr:MULTISPECIES: hypothetical protein [Bifidobacterium]
MKASISNMHSIYRQVKDNDDISLCIKPKAKAKHASPIHARYTRHRYGAKHTQALRHSDLPVHTPEGKKDGAAPSHKGRRTI